MESLNIKVSLFWVTIYRLFNIVFIRILVTALWICYCHFGTFHRWLCGMGFAHRCRPQGFTTMSVGLWWRVVSLAIIPHLFFILASSVQYWLKGTTLSFIFLHIWIIGVLGIHQWDRKPNDPNNPQNIWPCGHTTFESVFCTRTRKSINQNVGFHVEHDFYAPSTEQSFMTSTPGHKTLI